MDFRILGPFEVDADGRAVDLGGAKQRALLALLAIHANRVVARDQLVEALWDEEPPETAGKALQVYVSQLRKLLGRERVETKSGGYLLRLEPDELDLARFERLQENGKPDEALALWRGDPLADFAEQRFARAEIARLQELRLACLEQRIERDLAEGRHAELVGELDALVREYPLREHLRAQLMLAFYRAGRQAEALEAYQAGRSALVDQLGIEPGRTLHELHQQILRQDPALDLPAPEPPERPAVASVPSHRPPPARQAEMRKTVTVLFCDLAESTELGERLDPESLRALMARWFGAMREPLERHGGTVEKFIGDAVMAVFGVPHVHEDDALRAVRTAVEMRERLTALNEELAAEGRPQLQIRIGVNSGEVVTGDHATTLVTGDAVNTAKRLEQAAGPDEILIGDQTRRLVENAAVLEPSAPVEAKGKRRPVVAWRVLGTIAGAASFARRLDAPFVGRSDEFSTLRRELAAAERERSCRLVTVLGPAGLGKSRLASELTEEVQPRATVLTARCLSYGEGITFGPVVAVLKEAARIAERDSPDEARGRLEQLLPADRDGTLIGDRLAGLLGLAPASPGIQETFWAVRKLFEHLASQRPLVVVFDDIHWGQPTFLDLLEYLADWIRAAPMLIVCLARPELLEARPSWIVGRGNATLMTLQPLTMPETEGLIRNLIGGADLPREARDRISDLAEGNPLFVEETLRMLVDDAVLENLDRGWTVTGDLTSIRIPPTIQALLTARLDRLESESRDVIELASIVGRVFRWGALAALSTPDMKSRLSGHLQSLVGKELIRPDYSDIGPEDAFRFAHVLVRDAAYGGIPKSVRARLHEQLADWIEAEEKDGVGEYEEILGYHLEQAYLPLLELGPMSEQIQALGVRAAVALGVAGKRAFARGDMPAAVNLLSRAVEALPGKAPERHELLAHLAFALMETGDLSRLEAVVAETTEAAAASGDAVLQARAAILGLSVGLWTNPEGWAAKAEGEAERAISTFQEVGDERGLAKGWSLLGLLNLSKAQFQRAEEAWLNAADHAHLAGDLRDELESLSWVPLMVWAGPTPADEGLRRCQEVLERVNGDKKATASVLMAKAVFEAGLGRPEEARELVGTARSLLQEVALTVWLAGPLAQFAGWAELLAGDPAAAEAELSLGYQTLSDIGELGWLQTVEAILAEAVYAQGRYDEADRLTLMVEESADADDVYSQVLWRSVRAKVLARRGEAGEAERLGSESVDLAAETDFLHLRWHALMSEADVLQILGRSQEARRVFADAIHVAKQKGSLVGAWAARDKLERLGET